MGSSSDVQIMPKKPPARRPSLRATLQGIAAGSSALLSAPRPPVLKYDGNSVSPGLESETESSKAFAMGHVASHQGSVQSSVEPSSSNVRESRSRDLKGKGKVIIADSEGEDGDSDPVPAKRKRPVKISIRKVTEKKVEKKMEKKLVEKKVVKVKQREESPTRPPPKKVQLPRPIAKPDSGSDGFDSLFNKSKLSNKNQSRQPAKSKRPLSSDSSSSSSDSSGSEIPSDADGVKITLKKKKSPIKRVRRKGKDSTGLPDWTRGIGPSGSTRMATEGGGNRKRKKDDESGSDINSDTTKSRRSKTEQGMRRVLEISSADDSSDEEQAERRRKRQADLVLNRQRVVKSRSLTPPSIVVPVKKPKAIVKALELEEGELSTFEREESEPITYEIPAEPERIINVEIILVRDPTKVMSAKAISYFETPFSIPFSSKLPFSQLSKLVATKKNLEESEISFTFNETKIYSFGTLESLLVYETVLFKCYTLDVWEKTQELKLRAQQPVKEPSEELSEAEPSPELLEEPSKEPSPSESSNPSTIRLILRSKSITIPLQVKKSMKISSILKTYFKKCEIIDSAIKESTWLEFDGEKLEMDCPIGEVEDFEDEEFIDVRTSHK